MNAVARHVGAVAAVLVCLAAIPAAQAPAAQDPAADLVRQGQQKARDGKLDEALALFRQALQSWPSSFAANSASGVALDLIGQYSEARKHFTKALQVASSPQQKESAQRAMAMSYGFEGNCQAAIPFESDAYEAHLAEKDY
jgi:Flp pilus assembly protein TadD